MGAALYFVEGLEAGSAEQYRQLGLEYALGGSGASRGAQTGPGGAAGMVTSLGAGQIGYYPDRQVWHSMGLRGQEGSQRRVWFGWFVDRPPGPADLQRDGALPGHRVRMFNDEEWTVPAAMQFDSGQFGGALPQVLDLSESGEWTLGPVKQRYERLWQVASEFFDAFMRAQADESEEGVRLPKVVDMARLAVDVLAANYRVSALEVAKLGLLDSRGTTAVEVLKAAIDWPTAIDWQKKSAGAPGA